MSLDKTSHVIFFAFLLGVLAYLASALWSALFIVSLPMAEDAVVTVVEVRTGEDSYESRPVEFKSKIEELKYVNYVLMRERNSYWVYGMMVFGAVVGLFVFYMVPKWRNDLDGKKDVTGVIFGACTAGLLAVLIVPRVIGLIIPAPVKWFPKEIVDISEMREKQSLDRLKRLARELEARERERGE